MFCVNLVHLRTFILRYTNVLIIITRTVQPVATSPIAITSIRQLLSSCCYLFTVLNSGLLFYTKRVPTMPTTPTKHVSTTPTTPTSQSAPICSITDTFLNSSVKLIVV